MSNKKTVEQRRNAFAELAKKERSELLEKAEGMKKEFKEREREFREAIAMINREIALIEDSMSRPIWRFKEDDKNENIEEEADTEDGGEVNYNVLIVLLVIVGIFAIAAMVISAYLK